MAYRNYYRRAMKIKCAECGEVVKVYGQVWRYRLKGAERDQDGNCLGWNCDRCADRIEGTFPQY